MGNWHIVIPQEATNLVANPSLERTTTGYTSVGDDTAIARTADRQRRGGWSLAITPDADPDSGVYYGTVALLAGAAYVVSLDVWAPAGHELRLLVASTGGVQVGDALSFTGIGNWQRVTLQHISPATADRRIYLLKTGGATSTIYIDGLQVEAGDEATTYIDGEQAGCQWLGPPHNSRSRRRAQTRAGGRIIDLEDLGIVVQRQSGTGMPPVENVFTDSATLDGSTYKDTRVLSRPFTLTFWVNSEAEGFAGLHVLRDVVIDLLRPDRVARRQPVRLHYYGAAAAQSYGSPGEKVIDAVYEDGLRLEQTRGYTEMIAVRLLAPDPYIAAPWQEGGTLERLVELSGNLRIAECRDDGVCQWLGGGLNANPSRNAVIVGSDNRLYVGGAFTSPYDRVARWNFDTEAWEDLGGGLGQQVNALIQARDGTIYAGLNASVTISSVSGTVVRWDGSSWAVVGTGMSDVVLALAEGENGIYAGGYNGSSPTLRRWNGSAWNTITTSGSGTNPRIFDLVYDSRLQRLYVIGRFTDLAGNAALDHIAAYDTAAAAWASLGGANQACYSGTLGSDGTLYVMGGFTTIGGRTITNFAAWNGSRWHDLPGVSGTSAYTTGTQDGEDIVWDPYRDVLYTSNNDLGARFASPSGFDQFLIAWQNNNFILPRVRLLSFVPITIAPMPDRIVVALVSASLTSAGVVTLTNTGTAEVQPRLTLRGVTTASTVVYQIENVTTGDVIAFRLIVAGGEVITLDMAADHPRLISNRRGDITDLIFPGSDLTTFRLLPGPNTIAFYTDVDGATNLEATLHWSPRYWSVDGGGR